MKLNEAQAVANELVESLRTGCERIEVAGSVRRGKPEPKDIEVVVIAKWQVIEHRDLLGDVYATDRVNLLDDALEHCMGEYGPWDFDTETPRNGPKYKRLRNRTRGVCCDLFITTPAAWGTIFTIRTGPGAFSQALVTMAQLIGGFVDGGRLHMHKREYKLVKGEWKPQPCKAGDACTQVATTPDERDFFRVLGVPWLEPHERTIEQAAELLKPRKSVA